MGHFQPPMLLVRINGSQVTHLTRVHTVAAGWLNPRSAGGAREPEVGIEPTTYRLQGGCSTTELHRRVTRRSYVSDGSMIGTRFQAAGHADQGLGMGAPDVYGEIPIRPPVVPDVRPSLGSSGTFLPVKGRTFSMATVTYAKATRIYPGNTRPAVDQLDLQIADGEFLVLVGPSGCGKSTSLRMLAGLEEIDQGAIYIDETDVTNVPPKARDIAMVFQNYALYPHMTVYENMAFALKLRKTPKPEIDRRVKDAARLLDMDESLLSRKPKALSGGQRQRVAMGRAIVREPQVFLMDEPLSNLDAKLRVQTRAQIAALQQRLGVTTVYVTHDQVEAMTMGDRVAVLLDGILQQVDAPADAVRPAGERVRRRLHRLARHEHPHRLADRQRRRLRWPARPAHPRAGRGGPRRRRRRQGHGRLPAGAHRTGRRRRGWHPGHGRAGRGARLGRVRARPRRRSTAGHTARRSSCAPTAGSSRGSARPSTCARAPARSTCSTPPPATASNPPRSAVPTGRPCTVCQIPVTDLPSRSRDHDLQVMIGQPLSTRSTSMPSASNGATSASVGTRRR